VNKPILPSQSEPAVSPATWLVSAGRPSEPGAPLNPPLVPASNFILGSSRAYSRDDATPAWEAFETVVGGLEPRPSSKR
jgi:cystathionine gamma-synthase